MSTQVIMPQLGESVVEGTVTKWLRKVGESIDELEPLLEVTTDKVDTEIPSPAGGVLLKIAVPEDTTVKAGTILAWIGQLDEKIPGETEVPSATEDRQGETMQAPVSQTKLHKGDGHDLGFISPVVARLAHEHSIDLSKVKPSGEGGRITKRDVLAYLDERNSTPAKPAETAQAAATQPMEIWETPADGDLFRPTEFFSEISSVPSKQQTSNRKAEIQEPKQPYTPQRPISQAPETETGTVLPLTSIRKAIAEHMVLSRQTSPHVTTVMEADLSRLQAHLEANKSPFEINGARLTYTTYFISAAVSALQTYPLVNSSWTDQGIFVHKQINIGLAVALENEGLIVPVVKKADELSLLGLAKAVNDLATRARSHRLAPDEVRGGTFSLTNHGISGSLFATPIINQPQCAILGTGIIQKRVVVIHDAIAIRPMVYLTLTFDHRILDGAIADHFLAKIVEILENWQ